MHKNKYIEDLIEIKNTMSRASRFITLSGLSGVSTGITAILGVLIAYLTVFKDNEYLTHNKGSNKRCRPFAFDTDSCRNISSFHRLGHLFYQKKIRKQNQNPWNIQAQRLIIELSIPLITGGILCLMFLFKGYIGVLSSLTLVFYGLALINSSKYTINEIKNLGIIEIILGLIAFHFINYSLLLWAIGFGIFQIIYGLMVQKNIKCERDT